MADGLTLNTEEAVGGSLQNHKKGRDELRQLTQGSGR